MGDFHIGETWRPEDATEEEARAILGDAVYETWLKHKDDPRTGTATVTAIDSDAGIITFDVLPKGGRYPEPEVLQRHGKADG